MFCTNCNESTGGFDVCPKCGNFVGTAPHPQPQPQPQQPVYQQAPPQTAMPQQPVYQQAPPPQPVYQQAPPPPQAAMTPQPVYQQAPPPPQPVYQQAPPPQPTYQQAPPPPPVNPQAYVPYAAPVKAPKVHYAPGTYIEALHYFGASTLFLVGIIMFSAGKLFSIFLNFTWTSIFSMMILALPVTGFWLIFAASKDPKPPEKTVPALKLFKASAIILLIQSCLAGLAFLIGAIMLFAAGSAVSSLIGAGGGITAIIGIVLLLVGAALVTVNVLYYKSIVKILGGIELGITQNVFQPLPDIKFFTLLTYITVGLSALGALISMVISIALGTYVRTVTRALPDFIGNTVEDILGVGGLPFAEIFTLTGLAGIILCVIVLNKFNSHYFGSTAPTP